MKVNRAQQHPPTVPNGGASVAADALAVQVAAVFLGATMHQASMSSSRSSSQSRTGSRARTQLYRSSLRSGIMNLAGSLATRAARSSFGKPNPSRSESGETEA